MTTPVQENARMLASVLGIAEEEAAEKLVRTVLLTSAGESNHRAWAEDIRELLSLTITVVSEVGDGIDAELVVGPCVPRSGAPVLHAWLATEGATVSRQPPTVMQLAPRAFLAACAAPMVVGAVLNHVLAAGALPPLSLPMTFRFDQLGLADDALNRTRDLTGIVLAGAGAVGHGFLRALRHIPVMGTLPIIDPKTVAEGNFNRCTYLQADDLAKDKAVVLAHRAQQDFSKLRLDSFVGEFGDYCKKFGPPAAVLVTVDSRRARRSIQSELPGAVIDASTTDIRAVVVHSHRQPTAYACLSCTYRHVPEEHARERAVAEGLGVKLDDVKTGLISQDAAGRIHAKYPAVDPSHLVGRAYDSLFKELCAAQALQSTEGRQVLAPFSFVSALAGAYLVVELLRMIDGVADTNYWAADPWGVPERRGRRLRPKLVDCEFCSRPEVHELAQTLWGQHFD
ncbi:ThiF family adenylyltransferase [Rhizobium leguminosarum]|uniref:ThiF family adenylyltransferase n=1 Tax=Rhizobium leguminosarum TaxID=384 RepID=UPI00103261C9|nr:ThiF family adenylyltransferase [Rhizobium leguminosarum]TAV76228.1 hypothetical protein ELI28_23040 [Rhizobium leguminosarum]TAV80827.1 hypothetical protein ELI27_23025 [Rhizobium leguminosarum]TAZ32553.1 hypothetical protein ELH73_23030 [Rhizobium leguminosarum]